MVDLEKPAPEPPIVDDEDVDPVFPGYRTRDFDLSCPNTGEICKGKVKMVTAAMSGITAEDVDSGLADEIRSRTCLKLVGYNALAKGVECTNEGPCEVRQTVVQSDSLRVALKGMERAHRTWFGLKRRISN